MKRGSAVYQFKSCLMATKAEPGESRHEGKKRGVAHEKTYGNRTMSRYLDAGAFIRECVNKFRKEGLISEKSLTALPASLVTAQINEKVASGEWSVHNAKTTVAALVKAEYGSEKALGVRVQLVDRDALNIGPREKGDERTKIRPYSPEDTAKIVAWVRDNATPAPRLGIQIAAGAGLRASEIVNLRVQDVDLRDGRIFVAEGKGGLSREVTQVSPQLLASLREAVAGKQISDRLVNCSERTLQRWVAAAKNAIEQAEGRKIEGNGVHGLRGGWVRGAVQDLITRGMSFDQAIGMISRELGHSRLEVIKAYYD